MVFYMYLSYVMLLSLCMLLLLVVEKVLLYISYLENFFDGLKGTTKQQLEGYSIKMI